MRKIIILLLVVFSIFACSENDSKTYSIKIRNSRSADVYDIEISMYSLDQTDSEHIINLPPGIESESYDFHFDGASTNGCGKSTDLGFSPIFKVNYTNYDENFEVTVNMDSLQSNQIIVVLQDVDTYIVER